MRWLLPISLILLVAGTVVADETDPQTSLEAWQVYHGDLAGTHYSSLGQIHRGNVGMLRTAWVYRTPQKGTLQCNPLIAHGLVYIATQSMQCLALDAVTGEERWAFDPFPGQRRNGICRGFTYWESADGSDRRLFFPAGDVLYALNASTGEAITSFGDKGRLFMSEGLDRESNTPGASLRTPAALYNDLLILGSNVGEGPTPAAPGHIRAYDVRTGQRRWIFHTIPHPGERGYETWPTDAWKTIGGVNCWAGLTVDKARGLVFLGLGSPSYDHFGGNRIGMNLFGNCVLALRADTGDYVWHFQAVHHDLWDFDLSSQPCLVSLRRDGKVIDAVAQATKMGHLFLLDRETGVPLYPVEERAVPMSTIPGEASWPTQPFPPEAFVYAQQRLTVEEVTDLNPAARQAVRDQLGEMITGDIFIPPGLKPSVMLPQFNGGSEWGGIGFDPNKKWVYVNASNEAEWISMAPAKPTDDITLGQLGKKLHQAICVNCHGANAPRVDGAPPLPALETLKDRLSKEQALEVLEKGRGQMPSFAALSLAEREAVIGYLFNDDTERRIGKEELTNTWSDEIPYIATGHQEFRDPEGYPVNKRPWGTLTAIDLSRGQKAWQVPLGTYPALEKQGLAPTGTFNIGGPLVTAGGLVFIGAAMDERFHAFDSSTGELLWETQLDAGGYATPATYAIDGRQYIIIAAGGAGKVGTKAGDAYYCFTLDL